MTGRLSDVSKSLDGRFRVTLTLDSADGDTIDELAKCDKLTIELKKYFPKRSLNANALLWHYCSEIANIVGSSKEEIYRKEVREAGQYTPLPIKTEAIEGFKRIWESHGIGWFIDVVDDSKLPGYKLVFAYHGSSTYDTKEMKLLLDAVITDAKQVGIEVISEKERRLMFDGQT